MARRTEGVTKVVSERTGAVTWRCRWSITTATGEREWGSKTFKTQSAAKTHLAAQKHAIHAGTYQAPVRLTMAEYAETWFPRMRHDWASSTAYTRRNQWTKYLAPVFGPMQLSAVTRAQCQRFVDGLVTDELKPHTVRGIHALLSKMLRHAEQDGMIPRNPSTGLRLPRTSREHHATWSAAEVQRFLAGTVDHPDHALYCILLTTGARIGEAIALSWRAVDLVRGTVTISDTLRRTSTSRFDIAPGTKTHRGRTLPLTPGCIRALIAHRERQAQQRQGAPAWDIRNLVFTNDQGAPVDQAMLRRRLDQAITDAGLPRLTPHGFRHTCATLLMEQGVHIKVVSDILGHATVQMSLNAYQHVSDSFRRAALESLSSVISDDRQVLPGTAADDR